MLPFEAAVPAGPDIAGWADFGVGVASAIGALTGLLFVAVSINLERILAAANLPRLAAATLLLFSTVLVASVFLLIPGQPTSALGVEFVATGLLAGIPLVWIQTRRPRVTEHTSATDWFCTRLMPAIGVPGLVAVAGLGLLVGFVGSLYFVAAAAVLAIVSGLLSAWILLVEIQR